MANDSHESTGFRVDRSKAGGRIVLTPTGSLAGEHSRLLKEALDEAAQGHSPEVILDCRSVHLMDSEGLETMLEAQNVLRERGGCLKIARLNDVCTDIFVTTRLVNVFQVFQDINMAMKSL